MIRTWGAAIMLAAVTSIGCASTQTTGAKVAATTANTGCAPASHVETIAGSPSSDTVWWAGARGSDTIWGMGGVPSETIWWDSPASESPALARAGRIAPCVPVR